MYAIWWGVIEKGHAPFAAKIVGFDPTYTFARVFVNGYRDYSGATKSRRYGVRIYFPLEPNSIYDVYEVGQGKSRYRAFLLTDDLGDYQEVGRGFVIQWLMAKNNTQDATS